MCAICTAKRAQRPTDQQSVGGKPHTHSHTLVRCQEKKGDVEKRSAETTEASVAKLDLKVQAIEQLVAVVDSKLDKTVESLREQLSRLERLEGFMERIERMLTK